MNAVTPHRPRLRSAPEPLRSCGCGGPLVAVLPIDGEDCAVCEECVAAHSDLIQAPDDTSDAHEFVLVA